MPALECAARTCLYNRDEYCSKGDIKVGGEDAKDIDDTCCTSFVEGAEESVRNSVGSPSEHIDVACDACTCMYNESRICDADRIHIAGAAASNKEDTACGTFECK